jgi:glycosyltransferase domain-containing protein
MDLSKITLVILSHNRQHCLQKTLSFYKDSGIQLLVLDNSPARLALEYIPKNCTYYNSDEPFAVRSAKAAGLVSTPYTIIGADDEIYLPKSLEEMQKFLDLNPDYVAVGGYAIAVWEYGPTVAAAWAYSRTYGYHNEEFEPLDRIAKHTGNGESPLTSFFTCNLARTWVAQECLTMYAKAPLLATDAISVLTICGAGKSKYLDLVYWIRNWNQSPRSHSGWNRKISLHEWWEDSSNELALLRFSEELEATYRKYTSLPTFMDAWTLILKSDKATQKRESLIRGSLQTIGEIKTLKRFKYHVKSLLSPKTLPVTAEELSHQMLEKGIVIPIKEFQNATEIVARILPYESW